MSIGAQSQSVAMCTNSNVVQEIEHDDHLQRMPIGMAHAPYTQPPMAISTPSVFAEIGQHESQLFSLQSMTPVRNFQHTAEKDVTAHAPYISQYGNQNCTTQTSAAYESSANSDRNSSALCTYMHTNLNIGDHGHEHEYQYTPMGNFATYNHQYK